MKIISSNGTSFVEETDTSWIIHFDEFRRHVEFSKEKHPDWLIAAQAKWGYIPFQYESPQGKPIVYEHLMAAFNEAWKAETKKEGK